MKMTLALSQAAGAIAVSVLMIVPARAQVALPAVQHTLRIFGCEVQPAEVLIRARRVTDVTHGSTATSPGPPDASRGTLPSANAHVVNPIPAGTPGDFIFQFADLAPTGIYRLGIKLIGASAQRCPNFAWSSSREPLFRAQDTALEVAAFALRSDFQVLGAMPGRTSEQWLGRDSVPFSDPVLSTRSFRWRSSLPGVTGGVLQIADRPFPKPGEDPTEFDPCETEGVLYSRSFQAAASGWTDAGAINFQQLLFTPSPTGTAINPTTSIKLELGMPLYIRVVPTIGIRMLCDPRQAGAPSEVILANVIPFNLEGVSTGPAITVQHVSYQPPLIDPTHPIWGVTERCYRVVKPHPPQGAFPYAMATPWDFYLAAKGLPGDLGNQFCIVEGSGSDDGWFESLTSSVTSFASEFVDGVGKLVDFAANTWDAIQDKVVDGVADALNELEIVDCNQGCRDALRTGLEIALASMGVPPSLPNFDELKQQGLDYLAAQVAEQTGVPGPIADLATQKAKEFVDEAVTSMRNSYSVTGLPDWLAPDIRLDPAYATLYLWGTGQTLSSNPRLIRDFDSVYAGAILVLPRRLPPPTDAPLAVPMVLTPNLAGIVEPKPGHTEYGKAVWFKNHWYADRYRNGCYHLVVTGLAPGDVLALVNLTFSPETLAPCSK